MGRAPCCDKANVKKGPWSPEEDAKLKEFIDKFGTGGNWIALPHKAGLKRCGKSCRLRWLNYLRPNIKHGEFTDQEDRVICGLYASIGSRWSIIASQLPGRTDNDIKNYWNTKLKKKMFGHLAAPTSHQRKTNQLAQQQQQQQYHGSQLVFSSSPSPTSQTSCYNISQMPLLASPNEGFSQDFFTANFPHSATTTSVVSNALQLPQNQQFHQVKEEFNMIAFHKDHQSCSSSDGSCTQISYGNKVDQLDFDQYGGNLRGEQLMKYHHDNFNIFGGTQELISSDKLLLGAMNENNNNQAHDHLLDYNYEEMKQLMNFSSEGCNYNNYNMSNSHHLEFPKN